MKSLTELINDWITEHGSAAITRDHLALWRDKAQILEKENIRLQEESTQLKELCSRLQGELKAKARAGNFFEYRGAAFKFMAGGGYEKAVFCPECHRAMFSLAGALPYSCERCNIHVDFTGNELAGVMRELPIGLAPT